MRKKHQWFQERGVQAAFIVLRLDNYNTGTADRGQFYPAVRNFGDENKAIWPTRELALHAAEWATKKFGGVYGVFQITAIVEQKTTPIQITTFKV